MAGHNKWSKIKRQKAVTDGKKSSVYTKMAKAIMVAVKTGGGSDPDKNFRLKAAIDKAKEFGVPKANIERAIEKGAGNNVADDLDEVTYEGFLPGGVGVMVFTATDNTNRTLNDVRTIFTKAGGSLGTVSYMFEKNGDEYKATMTMDTPEEHEEKIFDAFVDTSRLDKIQARLSAQKERQYQIQLIKESDPYKVLTEAKIQRAKLISGDHQASQDVEELDQAIRGLDREIEGLNELTDDEITDDTMALFDALILAREAAAARFKEKEEALYLEAEAVEDDIKTGQQLVEEQVLSKLTNSN